MVMHNTITFLYLISFIAYIFQTYLKDNAVKLVLALGIYCLTISKKTVISLFYK